MNPITRRISLVILAALASPCPPQPGPSGLVTEVTVIHSAAVDLSWVTVHNAYGPGPFTSYEIGYAVGVLQTADWNNPAIVTRFLATDITPTAEGGTLTYRVSGLNAGNVDVTLQFAIHVPMPPPAGGPPTPDMYQITTFPPVTLHADHEAPTAPVDFEAAALNESTVHLTWTAPEDPEAPSLEGRNVTEYRLEIGRAADGSDREPSAVVLPLPGTAGQAIDEVVVSDLDFGTWYFRLLAVDEMGNAGAWATASATLTEPPVDPRVTPVATNRSCGHAAAASGLLLAALGIFAGALSRRAIRS